MTYLKTLWKTLTISLAGALLALPSFAETVKTGALTLEIPDGWTQEQVRSSMRKAQFKVPAPKDSGLEAGEVVIFYFGESGGGGAQANIQRWMGQFDEAGRKAKIENGKSVNGDTSLVNITGTYNKPVGPPIRRQTKAAPGYQMIAVVVETEEGNYFIKFTGPEATVTAAEKDFRTFLGEKK